MESAACQVPHGDSDARCQGLPSPRGGCYRRASESRDQGAEGPIFEHLSSRHRADIDGLRAVAVIPVLLFHADVSGFDGGFLGVDVFFVISGFLITSILLGQAELGRLSITGFYNRRIRRIFPALFVLLAITTLIAAVLFTPSAFERYGRSLVATTLFSSNILFFLESGYFDAASHEKPLLHTWSLAVEEQFYLVWPLLIWAFIHFGAKRYLHLFLLAGVAASFALAAVLPLWSIEATFYLPFTRAWELGLGALLAINPPKAPVGRLRDLVCAAGLLAIVLAIVTFNDSTPLAAASGLACLGTAILIAYNNEKTIAARLLSLRLCVGIGLISYSLYLWHWPLLAFAHYYYSAPPALGLRLALLALATSLAWASYIFVEKPLRRSGPPRDAFIASIAVMAVLLAAGLAIIASRGFPQRFWPRGGGPLTLLPSSSRMRRYCSSGSRPRWASMRANVSFGA